MRLEEWFKHVESFEHTGEKQAGAGRERIGEEALSALPIESVADGSASALLSRFTHRSAEVPTFRSVCAPSTQHAFGGQSRAPKRQNGLGSILPVQKESREQLLARLLDPVLTLEETAQVLNVCPTTVRRYTNKGLLQHYRTTGNQRRFRLSHVLNFLGEISGALEKGTLLESLETSGVKRGDRVRDREVHRRLDRS